MENNSVLTKKVKQINKSQVYNYVYEQKTTCKLYLTQNLDLGLSTISQNLKLLEKEGFICKNGFYESTGGRKADALQIVADYRISIGVAILSDIIYIVAINLYGEIIHSTVRPVKFSSDLQYYEVLSEFVNSFIDEHKLENILGVAIATQGIISKDGTSVTYGEILGNDSMNIDLFQKYLKYPCKLEHDSKSAANLELWKNKDLQNGIIMLLNRNMGGAVIVNGEILNGEHMRSGIVEHLCMNLDGAMCYCGKRGCLETYCSASALENTSDLPINLFFKKVQDNDLKYTLIWEDYLNYLALAIRNLNMVIDGKFIISGYIAPFFRDKDIDFLVKRINMHTAFEISRENIVLGESGELTQAVGAGLYYIKEFLKDV